MKYLILILLIYSCTTNRWHKEREPIQAEIVQMNFDHADTVYRDIMGKNAYIFHDNKNNVWYVVYTYTKFYFDDNTTLYGIIRK